MRRDASLLLLLLVVAVGTAAAVPVLQPQLGWLSDRDCPRFCDQACECADARAIPNCDANCNACLSLGVPCGTQLHKSRDRDVASEARFRAPLVTPKTLETPAVSDPPATEPAPTPIKPANKRRSARPLPPPKQQPKPVPKGKIAPPLPVNRPVTQAQLVKVLKLQKELIGLVSAQHRQLLELEKTQKAEAKAIDERFDTIEKDGPMVAEAPDAAGALEEKEATPLAPVLPPVLGESSFTRELHETLGTPQLFALVNGRLVPVERGGEASPDGGGGLKRVVRNLERLVAWVKEQRATHGDAYDAQADALNRIIEQAVRIAK